MIDGDVRFIGVGPHSIKATQRVAANAEGGGVSMTLYVMAEGQGTQPVPLSTQLTADLAVELAGLLVNAANRALP
jgi:hypothetical protein